MSEHELWNELGNLYLLSGQPQQAVHAYRRSIQLDETFGRPYSNLALAYVQQGKYEEAIALYRRSIELLAEDREKALTWNRLGNVLRHLKDYRQAIVAFRNADQLDPEGGDGVDVPGWASAPATDSTRSVASQEPPLAIGDPLAQTSEASRVSTSIDPEDSTATWAPMDPSMFQQDMSEALDPGTLTTWGDTGLNSDDPDAAWPPEAPTEVFVPDVDGDDLSKWLPAPEEQPVDELEYSLEAVDLAAEDEEAVTFPDEAELLKVFGSLNPEPPDPDALRKPTAFNAGNTSAPRESAITLPASSTSQGTSESHTTEVDVVVQVQDEARTAVGEVQPREAQFAVEQRDAKRALDSLEAAEAARASPPLQRDADELREIEAGLVKFQRVVQVNPRNARAWDTLGNLYKSAGRYEEALEAYQEAIRQDASKAMFHHHVGLVYASEGRMDEAVDAFQRVLQMDPGHALAHAALGGYYRKKGLEDLAQEHIGIAMKSIFDSENEYNRACLAAICGNTEQALDLLRVALQNKQTYVDWILRDPDLDFIRQDPRFKQLISDYAG